MTALTLNINGIEVLTDYPEKDIEEVYYPLLKYLTALQKEKGRRIIVFLAAPPGCGKSTLGTFLQQFSQQYDELTPIQILGIDGFHHLSSYLDQIVIDESTNKTLRTLKGTPQTFDVLSLSERISQLAGSDDVWWPEYSRIIHEPEDNKIHVTAEIVLIEGNYLLYTEGEWDKLTEYCDYSIFMTNDYEVLKKRLIERKIKGGSSPEEAANHFRLVDGPNIEKVLQHRKKADLDISMDENNHIISYKKNTAD